MSTSAAHNPGRASGPKVLRVGIISNGKIIEERLLRKREAVTIGSAPRNTFQIPASDMPATLQVFDVRGSDYHLVFDEKMTGRVSLGEGVTELAALRQGGKAQQEGGRWRVKLSEGSRGKVVLGEVTILFQFVTPPPARPKAQLPAAMRGGWIRNLDWNLAIILLLSAVIQGGSVWYIQVQDWPEPRDVKGLPDRFVQVLAPQEEKKEPEKPEEELKPEEDLDGEKQKADEQEEKKVAKPKEQPKPADPDKRAAVEAARKKALAKDVENKTILKKLGALSPEGGTVADALRGGAAKRSLDEAFAGSSGVEEGTAGQDRSGLRRAGSADAKGAGNTADIGDLRGIKGAGEAKVDTGEKREAVAVKARVNIRGSGSVVGDGVIDKGRVSAVFKARAAALQSCYERELKKNPKLGGKLVVRFVIGSAGRVTSVNVSGSVGSATVNQCVSSRISGWKFPKPEGGSVTVSKSIVFSSSN